MPPRCRRVDGLPVVVDGRAASSARRRDPIAPACHRPGGFPTARGPANRSCSAPAAESPRATTDHAIVLPGLKQWVDQLKLLAACPFERIGAASLSLFSLAKRPGNEQEVASAPLDGAHPGKERVCKRVPDSAEPELVTCLRRVRAARRPAARACAQRRRNPARSVYDMWATGRGCLGILTAHAPEQFRCCGDSRDGCRGRYVRPPRRDTTGVTR